MFTLVSVLCLPLPSLHLFDFYEIFLLLVIILLHACTRIYMYNIFSMSNPVPSPLSPPHLSSRLPQDWSGRVTQWWSSQWTTICSVSTCLSQWLDSTSSTASGCGAETMYNVSVHNQLIFPSGTRANSSQRTLPRKVILPPLLPPPLLPPLLLPPLLLPLLLQMVKRVAAHLD